MGFRGQVQLVSNGIAPGAEDDHAADRAVCAKFGFSPAGVDGCGRGGTHFTWEAAATSALTAYEQVLGHRSAAVASRVLAMKTARICPSGACSIGSGYSSGRKNR